jgi:hypothetical protein
MDVLENFSLSKPYRFCMYLSSVILVSTLLNEPPEIDNIASLRYSCMGFIILGIISWSAENTYYDYLWEKEYDEEMDERELGGKYNSFKLFLNVSYFIIGIFILVYYAHS